MNLITAHEAAEMTGMSADYWYAQAREGRIPHYRLGRSVRFEEEDVRGHVRQHRYVKPRDKGQARALSALYEARRMMRHGQINSA